MKKTLLILFVFLTTFLFADEKNNNKLKFSPKEGKKYFELSFGGGWSIGFSAFSIYRYFYENSKPEDKNYKIIYGSTKANTPYFFNYINNQLSFFYYLNDYFGFGFLIQIDFGLVGFYGLSLPLFFIKNKLINKFGSLIKHSWFILEYGITFGGTFIFEFPNYFGPSIFFGYDKIFITKKKLNLGITFGINIDFLNKQEIVQSGIFYDFWIFPITFETRIKFATIKEIKKK